jgi:protoporphyrinogen oxidase
VGVEVTDASRLRREVGHGPAGVESRMTTARTTTSQAKRVAILGGGIGGLASAHYLLNAGFTPVVLEATDRLGGLGTWFDHRGVHLDKWYHVILDSDADLVALLEELGIADRLVWRETGMGFRLGGALYGFNSPLDLLRFRALSFGDRLRTGLGAAYITKIKKHGLDLDDVYACDWLRRVFGERVYARIWEPLLRAKFGDRIDNVPAYWVWNTLNREKNGDQEVKGYLRGGYEGFAESLREAIVARGGEVRLGSPVAGVETNGTSVATEIAGREERFDAVISTLPIPRFADVARGALATDIPIPDLNYQGCVNAVVVSRRQLERFYWTIVVDPAFPFQGVVETTHVIPSEWIGGRHLIYCMNYCEPGSEPYQRSDELVKRQALDGLSALYPDFRTSDVEDVYVFRAPHVEPVWTVGYLRKRPAPRIGASRVYLSTTAQAYPRVTAWNTSIGHARGTLAALVNDLS